VSLKVSKQAEAQVPSAPCVSALRERLMTGTDFLIDPIIRK